MTVPTSTRHVHAFDAADGAEIDRLGGKGAGLARMTSLGLPVPPGFTVDTGVCQVVLRNGALPDDIWDEVLAALQNLEDRTGRTFGSGPAPLLLSVRSGAAVSMPGMMDTVLDLGASKYLIDDLAAWAEDPHFAYDARRRLLQMFGGVVLGVTRSDGEMTY